MLELWYFTWVSLVMRPFRGLHYLDLVTLTLEFDILLKKINLAYNFWIVGVRALIFHMTIPCYNNFPWVPLFFTLWPWPWSMTHFLKNFNLGYNIWTVGARALIFQMSIPCDRTLFFAGTIIFYPVTLALEFDPFFKNLNLANNFWIVSARALKFHMWWDLFAGT